MTAMFLAGFTGALIAEIWARSTWVDNLVVTAMGRLAVRVETLERVTSENEGKVDAIVVRLNALSRRVDSRPYSPR